MLIVFTQGRSIRNMQAVEVIAKLLLFSKKNYENHYEKSIFEQTNTKENYSNRCIFLNILITDGNFLIFIYILL